jgi:ribosome-binding protein aMBF1 (putative translation factor)
MAFVTDQWAVRRPGLKANAMTLKAPPEPPPRPPVAEWPFGERLKHAREINDMSGVDLAKALKIPYQTLSTWEKGAWPNDTFKLCERLEEVLQIPRTWFAGWWTEPE